MRIRKEPTMAKRENYIIARVSEQELENVKQVAAEHDHTVSQLLRVVLRNYIEGYKRRHTQEKSSSQ